MLPVKSAGYRPHGHPKGTGRQRQLYRGTLHSSLLFFQRPADSVNIEMFGKKGDFFN